MKFLKIFLLLFISVSVNATTTIYNVTTDTTLSGNWNLGGGILRASAKISGTAIISNGYIEASQYIQIFDTTISIASNVKIKEFSAMWYGANSASSDNYSALEKSILTCVNAFPLHIPTGIYKYSKKLFAYYIYLGNYASCYLNMYGDGDIWNTNTELWYQGIGDYGFGIQYAKGGWIHNLYILGNFKAPLNNGLPYYSLTESQFNDTLGVQPAYNHWGFVIDPDGTKNQGGSTALKITDMWVDGFDICYNVSPNGYTYNAENLDFERIRVGQGRIGYESNQAQEKGNQINFIVAWANTYTLFSDGVSGKFQGSHTTVRGGNVAGGVIRVFNIQTSLWYPFNVYDLFCESIGTVGSILSSSLPISFTNCTFNFASVMDGAGKNLMTTNSPQITFQSCGFRFFGTNDVIPISGASTMVNCIGNFTNTSPTNWTNVTYPPTVPTVITNNIYVPPTSNGVNLIKVSK